MEHRNATEVILVSKVNCFAAAAKPLVLLFAYYFNSIYHLCKLYRNTSVFFSRTSSIFCLSISLIHFASYSNIRNNLCPIFYTSLDIMATKALSTILVIDTDKF